MVREAPSSDIRDPGNEEKLVCKQKLLHLCVHISITFPTYISFKLPPCVCGTQVEVRRFGVVAFSAHHMGSQEPSLGHRG